MYSRDDGGQVVRVGYTSEDRAKRNNPDFISAAWSKSLSKTTYTEEQLREMSLQDSTALGLLLNIPKTIVPNEVIRNCENVRQKNQLPRMDCKQNGMGRDFDFVVIPEGKQHVVTALEKVPPCGFAAINYANKCEFVISLTTSCDLSVSGGDFYSSETGYLVEQDANALMVDRTKDLPGIEISDISPKDQKAYVYGLSLAIADGFGTLWSKTRCLLLARKDKQVQWEKVPAAADVFEGKSARDGSNGRILQFEHIHPESHGQTDSDGLIVVRSCVPSSASAAARVGKTMAYTSIKFTNDKDELVARGSHTKYVAQAWKDENNIVEELAGKR
ncbi:MAG: hypothetical protein LQ343_002556 [Gyalolechia ehrenbergii]|nr:MAG: hypothetical protein LQ343_002556 [Gyalolechia ehrenbergii]